MAIIQMTPELMRDKANEVRVLKSNHDETMEKLGSLIRSLNEQWKGEAQDAFVAKFDSMQGTFKGFSEMLESYAKLMDHAANNMQETDQSLKVQMQNSFS